MNDFQIPEDTLMITYNLNNLREPLYEYIYRSLKRDIISGQLKAGEKLPSKRSFAENNGVSTITIQNAYDQLICEGYIYTLPKKGYYVSDIGVLSAGKPERTTAEVKVPAKKRKYELDLTGNAMEPDSFPFATWAKLMRRTLSDQKEKLLTPSPTAGIPELRDAIAEYLRSFRGMTVDPNQIVIGAGTEYLYGLLIQLLGEDRIYCIENPGYRKLVQIYNQYHIGCRYAPMDEKGVTVQGLRRTQAQIAHISPNHHFPTGITMPADRRYEILHWADEDRERYIIEDDYDSEFRTNGKPMPTLFSIDTQEKVIYMNTFSKSLTPTIRISYMVLPGHLADRFYETLSFYSCTVSNFEQYTLAAFISEGYFEKHINRMRLQYTKKRNSIMEVIKKSRLREFCRVEENDSGLHFILQFDTKTSDEELKRRLGEKGIHMDALSEYELEGERKDRHRFILNYSGLDPMQLESAADGICTVLENR